MRILSAAMVGLILCFLTTSILAADAKPTDKKKKPPTTSPATQPETPEQKEKRLKKTAELEKYYAEVYAKPTTDRNRLARMIGVISLSRINAHLVTQKLLVTLQEADPLVGQLAWEAVHVRLDSLTKEERQTWISAGLDLATRNAFRGYSAEPLLKALGEQPIGKNYRPTIDFLVRVATENDPNNTRGKSCLDAAKATISAWRDPEIATGLVNIAQSRPLLVSRISYMIQGLPDAPPFEADPTKARGILQRYLPKITYKPAAESELKPYVPPTKGLLFPKPIRIDNPFDPKWREEIELGKLNLDLVEIAFCLDANSSDFVAAYVEAIVQLLKIMSDQVRCATVYYRHETDPKYFEDCCKKVDIEQGNVRVFQFPFTTEARDLVKNMRAKKFPGHSGHKGSAYFGALSSTDKLEWTSTSKKIIVITGDGNPTPNTIDPLKQLTDKLTKDETLLIYMSKTKAVANQLKPASKIATNSDPIVYEGDLARGNPADPDASIDAFKGTGFEKMIVLALKSALPGSYKDRAQPLIDVTIPLLKAQAAANRATPK